MQVVRMTLPTWLNHLEERFSYKEVLFRKVCLPVKTSCPAAEDINETPKPDNANALLSFKCFSFSS